MKPTLTLAVVHALEPLAGWAGFDPKQVFGAAISTDEGRTWKLHGAVRTAKAGLENMIVALRDGRLWMLIRTEKVLWESHSSDKGRTWTEGTPTTIATPHSRFFIRRLASGNLLLVNHYKFTGRSHLTAQLSTDDGATWNDGLLLDERHGVSYPDGVQDKDGLIWITYDRDRGGLGEILLAKFKEEDVVAGKSVSGAVSLKQVVNKLDKLSLLSSGWNPKAAADKVLAGLIRVSAPQVKGAHDGEFVCVDDRAYIVEHDNDVAPGHGAGAAQYCVLSIVNLRTLAVEKTLPMAKSEQAFDNVTLPKGMCFVPRIIRKDEHTLRTYFCSQPDREQAITFYRDFDLRTLIFEGSIHRAKLKTAAGTFDMEPRHFHADAAAQGFTRPAVNHGLYIFDSFKEFDGRRYVALNNFPGKQNALAVLHDDFATFEVIGHYNDPQSQQLSESAVNRLPDGTWSAIVRNDAGNYHFTTSKDGRAWTTATQRPFVPNGLNSKPTFDKFGGIYYLGWQENTKVGDCGRSVFNVDISRDGRSWERKYRFESPHSFQYPTFHEHDGTIWLTVTQSDHKGSSDRIMFGRLEELPKPKPAVKVTQELLNSIHVTPKLIVDPMPAYGQKYLPFAMAASMDSTKEGRLWTCWAGGQQMLAGKNRYSRNERQWSLTIEPDGKLKAHLRQNDWSTILCAAPLTAGRWHLATLVADAQKALLYLNGKLVGEVKLASPITATAAPITLGGIWDAGAVRQAFHGAVDEFSFQPRALSATEIATSYQPVSVTHDVPKLALGLPLWDATQTLPKAADLPQVAGAKFYVLKRQRPDEDGCNFTLGVGLVWHKGKLYASYGFNKGNENTVTEEAHVRVSEDGGQTWGKPVVMDAGEGNLGVSHGVFLSHGGKLWAFMGAFYDNFQRTHARAYWLNETSGEWEPQGVVLDQGFWPMQEPQRMADGNWIMAGFRVVNGFGLAGNLPAVAISQGDDFTKWKMVVIQADQSLGTNLWGESTVIVEKQRITNIARYGAKALALVSTSEDHGRTWTPAAASNLPMATSKPYAGTLSNGQRYLVCTTTANTAGGRSPLTIAVSKPGESVFSRVFLIRTSEFEGTPGVSRPNIDFSYPYAVEHDGQLYIGYTHKSHAANELAVIPVSSLEITP